jgi:hypothetical protein
LIWRRLLWPPFVKPLIGAESYMSPSAGRRAWDKLAPNGT